MTISIELLELKLSTVLAEMGVDLLDEETRDTPKRWAKVLAEFSTKPPMVPNVKAFPNKGYSGMVYDRCEIYSLCSHHMLPVVGVAHMAYLPTNHVLGLSKLSRIADHFARQPTTQEWLTQTIAEYIQAMVNPKGVAVRIEAKHLCKCSRGIGKQEGMMGTTVLLGAFMNDQATREEFLSYVGRLN